MSASIERVLERLAIPARKIGRRWWTEHCPNPEHANRNEKHRWKNWFVRADGTRGAGLHHCFSCKFGGNLVALVAKVRGCDDDEAKIWLRDVEDAPAPAPVVRVRFAPMGARRRPFCLPAGVELGPLAGWNSVARAYAVGRGITAGQVDRWAIGWALEGRCEGRVVFPIVDASGRLVNYAARTFVGDPTRYLAADEEREEPDVAAVLGERFWPAAAERARATCVVFEGAISGMAIERALHVAGARAFLAGLQGSDASNPRRIARLATFGRVVSAADPDRAGDSVSEDLASSLRRNDFRRMEYPRRGVDAADEDPERLAAALAAVLA